MDKDWLLSLDPKTIVVVPTNSLAHHVAELYSEVQLEQGKDVWHSPNVLVWSDFIKSLWSSNRQADSVSVLLSPSQSDFLWTKIIEQSARKDEQLLLLNVPQTVRAVRSSWQKMYDWCIDEHSLEAELGDDNKQLLIWFEAYRAELSKRNLVDLAQLPSLLFESVLEFDFTKLQWFSYDLITRAQERITETLEQQGVAVDKARPMAQGTCFAKHVYNDERSEIIAIFEQARRQLLDMPNQKMAIVIPDLQHRYQEVEEIARDVFYPHYSPLEVRQNGAAYRFSLGHPLLDLAPINTALCLIDLLRGAISLSDLKLLFRSVYISKFSDSARADSVSDDSSKIINRKSLLRWLGEQRVHRLSLSKLKSLYEQSTHQSPDFIEFLQHALSLQEQVHAQLSEAKEVHGFASLSFSDWQKTFDDWLSLWGWSTAVNADQPSSHEYQLQQRWNAVNEQLIGLGMLQKTAGFARVIDLFKKSLNETLFLPKASSAPIIVSGALEAIGRQVDRLFIIGMHQDFPKPVALDAFISKRVLAQHGHPHASVEKNFDYQKQVIGNLLNCADEYQLSYARASESTPDIERVASPLFEQSGWQHQIDGKQALPIVTMESYQDSQGPVLAKSELVRGGARIFENQSNCAFRAFASHRLRLRAEQEVDFGLDALDRGNIVHHLLDTLWGDLKSQEALSHYSDDKLKNLIEKHIRRAIETNALELVDEKLSLLKHECGRLKHLLFEWMQSELNRPHAFKVVSREVKGESQLGGVPYRYIIDRIDELPDGRLLVIDYKTGSVSRNDWIGERIKSPQLPLYALSIDELDSEKKLAGISFAKIKRWSCAYEELAEDGVFRASTKQTQVRADLWRQESATWQDKFEALAQEFQAGHAQVNPIEKATCNYCEFSALCRVTQLRGATQ